MVERRGAAGGRCLCPGMVAQARGRLFSDRDFFFIRPGASRMSRRWRGCSTRSGGGSAWGPRRARSGPEVGAVHLAAGYLISQMLGCEVRYHEDHPPQVVPRNAREADRRAGEGVRKSGVPGLPESGGVAARTATAECAAT